MSTSLEKIEEVLVQGNLQSLNPEQRVSYYKEVCNSLGLNPLTKPFEYITLNNKLTLYATRACTDQLRKINKVSVRIKDRQSIDGVYVVTAEATDSTGRIDESIGAVPVLNLKGDALANALMKSETKAKRRATLSICGLGFLDESEIEGALNAPFKSASQNVDEVVRPQIENTTQRKKLIKILEGIASKGLDDLANHWKTKLTKAERDLVGAVEIARIKKLTDEPIKPIPLQELPEVPHD